MVKVGHKGEELSEELQSLGSGPARREMPLKGLNKRRNELLQYSRWECLSLREE
jgi:hypothetical protein